MASTIRARCRKGLELAAELDEWARQRGRIEDERRESKRRQLNAIRGRNGTAPPSDETGLRGPLHAHHSLGTK
jgi:hypothetical protein